MAQTKRILCRDKVRTHFGWFKTLPHWPLGTLFWPQNPSLWAPGGRKGKFLRSIWKIHHSFTYSRGVLCQNFKGLALKTAEQDENAQKMGVLFHEPRELTMGQRVKGGQDQMETLENGPKGSLPIVYWSVLSLTWFRVIDQLTYEQLKKQRKAVERPKAKPYLFTGLFGAQI